MSFQDLLEARTLGISKETTSKRPIGRNPAIESNGSTQGLLARVTPALHLSVVLLDDNPYMTAKPIEQVY
jgi:hypothetical protein